MTSTATSNPMHSMESPEHGTPPEYVALAHYALFGESPAARFDLDPSSNGYWNHYLVNARRFCDERDDGLSVPWTGRLFVNPPGGKHKVTGSSLVRSFWDKLIEHHRTGQVHSAVWIGYSLEQLVVLQSSPTHPLQFITLIPNSRVCFMTRPEFGGPPKRSTAPTHGNYITLLHTRTSATESALQARRFIERASSLEIGGAIVRPM